MFEGKHSPSNICTFEQMFEFLHINVVYPLLGIHCQRLLCTVSCLNGWFRSTICPSSLESRPYPPCAKHCYCTTTENRVQSDWLTCCVLCRNIDRPNRLQDQVFAVNEPFSSWTQGLKIYHCLPHRSPGAPQTSQKWARHITVRRRGRITRGRKHSASRSVEKWHLRRGLW